MEAGEAPQLPKVPSRPGAFNRPPFSRPPFPSMRPVQMNGPLSPPGPSTQEYRPPAQYQRQSQSQDWRAQEQRPAAGARPAQGRDSWQRRRPQTNGPFTPPPHEPRDERLFARMAEVIGFPGYTRPQDLIHTFSEFGPAKVDRIYSNTAILVFKDSEGAAAAIRASTTVCLYGEFLIVRPYTKASEHTQNPKNYRRGDKNKPKGPTVDPTTLSWEGDVHQQLEALLTAVRLSQQEIHQLSALYNDLDTVLKGIWPGCRTIPFGSVTTGLGVKGSDADCFVLLPADADRAHAVPRARRALAQHPRVFTSLIAIPNANTPIVKFYHLPTRTHCDVSFKTLLGVQNSKLLGFLLHKDPRLLPVAVVIKYWASVHELSGTGKLTNYALMMMLVYYLQQSPHDLLPSVSSLQSDAATDYIVDGWNTGFMSHHDRLPRTGDTSSVADLIGGFFSFYTGLNLAGFAVCPYFGMTIRKALFQNLNDLPIGLNRYVENVRSGAALPIRASTPICVQDPFELCHNVASSVTTRLAAELDLYFKFAADVYEKEKATGCKNFLKKILVERPALPHPKGKVEFRASVRSFTLNNIYREDWRVPCEDVIDTIFNDILQVNLEPVQKAAYDAAEALDGTEKKRKRIKYNGLLTRAVWKRKKFSKLFSSWKLKFYDQEKKITDEIIATDNNEYQIPFQLVATFATAPRYVSLVIRPRGGDLQAFKEFGRFFQENMNHWFGVLVKPYCDKTNMKEVTLPMTDDEVNRQETDEESDSETDASTEDERTPVQDIFTLQLLGQQSDSEKSPSDTDKENIEEAVNVDSITASEDTHKTQTGSGRSRRRRKKNKKHTVNKNTPQPAASGGKDEKNS